MSSERIDWSKFADLCKDQGSCGSCVGHGTCAAVKGVTRVKYGYCPDLSERDDFTCAGGRCQMGTTMQAGLDKAVRGIATQLCCPNANMAQGQDSACGGNRCAEWWDCKVHNVKAVKIASYKQVTGLENILASLRKGPMDFDMQVPASFMNYVGGVWKRQGNNDPIEGGHCMVCWGADLAQQCFIIQNSWSGKGWGETWWGEGQASDEEGKIRIAFSEITTCSMHFWELEADGPVSPDPPPTPSPCGEGKVGAWIADHIPGLRNTRSARALSRVPEGLGRKGRIFYYKGHLRYMNPS